MITREKFPIKLMILTHKEQNELVYKVLKENPQGLLLGDIKILTGIGSNKGGSPALHKILNRLRNKVYIRNLGARIKLYYAKINTKKIIKSEERYGKL